MRKLTKLILPEVGVGNLKIRPRGDNRCESAKLLDRSTTNLTIQQVQQSTQGLNLEILLPLCILQPYLRCLIYSFLPPPSTSIASLKGPHYQCTISLNRAVWFKA